MKKYCRNYVGVACIDGTCPKANYAEYVEWDIPVIKSCRECYFYKGCEDCALAGTDYCEEGLPT